MPPAPDTVAFRLIVRLTKLLHAPSRTDLVNFRFFTTDRARVLSSEYLATRIALTGLG